MFEALGRAMYRRRRWVVAAFVAFLVFAGVWGTGVFGAMSDGGFDDPDSESSRAAVVAEQALGRDAADVVVLWSSPSMTVDDPAYRRAVTDTVAALPAGAVARSVTWFETPAPALVSKDRHATYAVLTLAGDADQRTENLDRIEGQLAAPGLQMRIGGGATVNRDINTQVSEDIARAETISLPVLAVLLVLIFGSVAAAGLPLAIGGVAILGAFTALRGFAQVTDVSVFAVNVVTILGLGLAIDYGLFMVSRFREEIHRRATIEDAVVHTMATAGRTVAVSGVTVALSLAGLLIFPQVFLRSMGFGGVSAVLVAMIAALTLLPALLAMLGTKVDAWSVRPLLRRLTGRRSVTTVTADAGTGVWSRVAHSVMRRPVVYTVVVAGALLTLAVPFTRIEFGGIDERALPSGAPSRVVAETIRADFPASPTPPIEAVVTFSSSIDKAALDAYAKTVSEVSGVDSATVTGSAGATARIAVAYRGDPLSDDAREVLAGVRAVPVPGGASVLVGGGTAVLADLLASLSSLLPWMALLVVAMTFVLLFLAFGSVVMPVKALVMNMLSLGASFGALVWIFQDGNLSGLLGFTSTGTVEATQPILILALVFGLSMDYEVFLMSRVREQYDLTGDNTTAVATGLQRTGGIITSAALLLLVVIGSFSLSGITFIKMIGVAMVIAISIDATIVRLLLVPATMRLLGDASWWAPGPLRRFYERYGFKESDGDEPTGPAIKANPQDKLSRTP